MRFIGIVTFLAFFLVARAALAEDLASLTNFYQHSEKLYTSGQPERTQFSSLSAAGVQVVVNMSPINLPASLPDEKELVELEGMTYHFIPIDWDFPSIDELQQFFQVMDQSKGKTILVHCWVNARSSAFVFLYRTIKRGFSEKEEKDVLSKIWENNAGYELRNVPHWQRFIANAEESLN